MTRPARRINTPTQYPCCFSEPFLREDIDPRIKRSWPKAPFGNLRRIWREQHCKTLNPYGSETCPYSKTDCAVAFYQAVETSLRSGDKPVAYFWRVAHSSALQRADSKPSARETAAPQRPRQPNAVLRGHRPGRQDDTVIPVFLTEDLHRALTRPSGIREVLGTFHFRPREGSADVREKGTK